MVSYFSPVERMRSPSAKKLRPRASIRSVRPRLHSQRDGRAVQDTRPSLAVPPQAQAPLPPNSLAGGLRCRRRRRRCGLLVHAGQGVKVRVRVSLTRCQLDCLVGWLVIERELDGQLVISRVTPAQGPLLPNSLAADPHCRRRRRCGLVNNWTAKFGL